MSLTEDLKESVGPLWGMTVNHPFVSELGDGTLSPEVFEVYFRQDHLFMRDWIGLMCSGVAKAPDFAHARPLAAFIHEALGGEEGLFQEYFRERGLSPEEVRSLEHLPTCLAYRSFLRSVWVDGSFHEIVATLLGIEWPYLEWGKRLAAAGKRPGNKYYQTWIDIHAAQELEDFVAWMGRVLDGAAIADLGRLKEIFLTTLRYEYLFWEMAYTGERWPDR